MMKVGDPVLFFYGTMEGTIDEIVDKVAIVKDLSGDKHKVLLKDLAPAEKKITVKEFNDAAFAIYSEFVNTISSTDWVPVTPEGFLDIVDRLYVELRSRLFKHDQSLQTPTDSTLVSEN